METEADAKQGFSLYEEGKFLEAGRYLERASNQNHPFAQHLYADICFRQLDDQPHSLKEAAMWYLLSSYGDTDSLAYVQSIVPDLFEAYKSPKEQMEAIVRNWVLDLTRTREDQLPLVTCKKVFTRSKNLSDFSMCSKDEAFNFYSSRM